MNEFSDVDPRTKQEGTADRAKLLRRMQSGTSKEKWLTLPQEIY